MKALVLGATGFIGGAICRDLVARGVAVRALRRPGSRTTALDGLPLEYTAGDLDVEDSLARAAEGCDLLFHAAAPYPKNARRPEEQIERAVASIDRVLAVALRAGVRRLVYVSSYTTIGTPAAGKKASDESRAYTPQNGDPLYFKMKLAMESRAIEAAHRGAPVVIVNPAACVGPGDVKPTMGRLLLLYAKWRLPLYLPGGMDVVDVRLAARAAVAAAERGVSGERYILAGRWVSSRDLARMAARASGVHAAFFEAPYAAVKAGALAAEALWRLTPSGAPAALSQNVEMLRRAFPLDATKARAALALEETDVSRAVSDAVAWFRKNGYL